MRYIYAVLVIFILTLSGCGKDPVVADLEALDQLGKSVFNDVNISGLNQKMMQAKTNEEKAAVLDEVIQVMDSKAKAMSAFKARTPEVSKLFDDQMAGINQSVDGAKRAKAAFLTSNQSELSLATTALTEGQKKVFESAKELAKLAKEKGFKLSH